MLRLCSEGRGVCGDPMTRANDDIVAICSHAGIDPLQYRSFNPNGELVVASRTEAESVVIPPARPIPHKPAEPVLPRSDGPRWRALRSIFDTAHNGTNPADGDLTARTLPVGSLSILGACGGVGVTTILATLGRMLSMRQERVLLVDGAVESMLPLYFGATDATTGRCSFLPQHGDEAGSLSVVSRSAEEAASAGPELWERLRHFGSSADRFLVDVWRDMTLPGWDLVSAESICLVVLIPDLHSAVRLRTLEQTFRERERKLGRRVTPYYILNKFDSSLPLHAELRNGFTQELGDRLLPFAIRRSDDVTHALAEGMTVADYTPDSAITDDFQLLLNWIQAARLTRRASA